ncbi:hypothetical protein L484_012988 [Morus notabilis]|uniref:Uncharacterized protein n=1 Tax=Morus notabilis TaxID=981085 RepID=W9S3E2_9ROSA|nr:hypothetical protein L484_012988 [Morus notabilis]
MVSTRSSSNAKIDANVERLRKEIQDRVLAAMQKPTSSTSTPPKMKKKLPPPKSASTSRCNTLPNDSEPTPLSVDAEDLGDNVGQSCPKSPVGPKKQKKHSSPVCSAKQKTPLSPVCLKKQKQFLVPACLKKQKKSSAVPVEVIASKAALPFPSVIYGVLMSQKDIKTADDGEYDNNEVEIEGESVLEDFAGNMASGSGLKTAAAERHRTILYLQRELARLMKKEKLLAQEHKEVIQRKKKATAFLADLLATPAVPKIASASAPK